MASLFDVAAGLSQYDDTPQTETPQTQTQTALALLDDTLQTLYGAQQPSDERRRLPSRLSTSKSSEALSARLQQLTDATAARARAVASGRPAAQSTALSADIEARTVLRELTEELERLQRSAAPETHETLARMLSDKYLTGRLGCLPATPFVLLARTKVTHKLAQLQTSLQPSNNRDAPEKASVAPSLTLTLTDKQHEALRKLQALPEPQLLKLPRAQRELVRFARRYEQLLRATPAELRALPEQHQRLILALQQRQSTSSM